MFQCKHYWQSMFNGKEVPFKEKEIWGQVITRRVNVICVRFSITDLSVLYTSVVPVVLVKLRM